MSGLQTLLGLIFGQVFMHASMTALRVVVQLQVLRTEGELAVGPLVGLFALGPLLFALPAGRLVDRLGYHTPVRLAIASTCGGAALVLCSGFVPALRYPLLWAGCFLSGGGTNLGMIAIQRAAGRSAHDMEELKRLFSWLSMAPSFSNFLGPTVAGALIDTAGFEAALLFTLVLPLGSLLCGRFVPREAREVAPKAVPRRAWDLLASVPVRRLLLVSWLMSASWDLHSFLVPVLGTERGLSASAIGGILGVFALSVTAIRFVLPVVSRQLSEATVLRAALLLAMLVFVFYPLAIAGWQMAVCASVLGVALGCAQPMVLTALHVLTPRERQGEALALRSMTGNASSVVMPVAFGAAGAALGAAGLFWTMSALLCGGSFLARALARPAPT